MEQTCIIVDDESSARDVLRIYLTEFIEDIKILDECNSVPEAVKSIRKNNPDLIFLDIGMPGYNGLELLDFFEPEEINFQIIFTTAYKEYALQAFRLSAIDYLLKPLALDELQAAVEKSRKAKINAKQYSGLKHNLEDRNDQLLHVKVSNGDHFIKIKDIIMLKGAGSYTEIHYESDNSPLLASRHLKHFEEMLSAQKNIKRSHRSFLVNTQKIRQLDRKNKKIILSNDCESSYSQSKLSEFI